MTDDKELHPTNPAALGALLRGDIENFVVAATPGGIEATESAGQARVVRETLLAREGTIEPTNEQKRAAGMLWDESKPFGERHVGYERTPETYRARWEALGFHFGEVVDDQLVHAELPEGWHVDPSDHSMWSYLYDPQGRERAAMFFKAAFYDYRASLQPTTRYHVRHWYAAPGKMENAKQPPWKVQVRCCVVLDGATPIWYSDAYDKDDDPADARAYETAIEWVTQHFPDWVDPFAHWDEPGSNR